MGTIMHKGEAYGGGGSNSNLIHKTYAEYLALPANERTDPDKYYYIDDVNIDIPVVTQVTNPSDGDVMAYDSNEGLWKNSKLTSDDIEYDENNSIEDIIESMIDSKSYIGMIIHSTTLDTMAKVVAIYGGTTWILHSGYVLRGASSGVTANSATKTGGNDNAIVVSHSHSPSEGNFIIYNSRSAGPYPMSYTGNASQTMFNAKLSGATKGAGSSGTNANIPNYKSVYIWERTA